MCSTELSIFDVLYYAKVSVTKMTLGVRIFRIITHHLPWFFNTLLDSDFPDGNLNKVLLSYL